MKPIEKARRIVNTLGHDIFGDGKYFSFGFDDAVSAAMKMHEWCKEKALKAFCHANCTEPTKKGCECEKSCKEFLIFKRKMEE